MDLRQGKEYGEFMRGRGWEVEKIGKNKVFLKKLPFVPFWVLKAQRYEEMDYVKLNKLREKYWVIFTVLEPLEEMVYLKGFRVNQGSFLPTKTVVVDLKKSKLALWRGLKKDVRQVLKKKKLRVREEKDVLEFRYEWLQTKRGYVPEPKVIVLMEKCFGRKMWILVAEKDGEVLAGMIVLVSRGTAYYYFAFTNEKGRRMGAQYYLVWEGMMRAKKKGLNFWDFEGIEDSRFPRKAWQGFSLFKKKFGGKEVSFPGSWQRYL